MNNTQSYRPVPWLTLVAALTAVTLFNPPPVVAATAQETARQILSLAGITGGLVIHVGCGEGELTLALRANQRFVVHGLDSDPDNVAAARRRIRAAGVYGTGVAVDRLVGDRLPYIDNLANLIVVQQADLAPLREVKRVLAPGGVAVVKTAAGWTKLVKPRPGSIDEWTHYLHDASGNPVAEDAVVGPPRHLQWVGSPRYSRHHDRLSSLSALVSAGGRVFYIFDEGSRTSILLPSHWKLIARDAFNGTILWKRDIPTWQDHLFPLKSGPAVLPRRLTARDDRVFVTLGLTAPVTALDAATGETLRTYADSDNTQEILDCDDVLLFVRGVAKDTPAMAVRRGKRPPPWWAEGRRQLRAVAPDTGRTLWTADRWVVPLTSAAANGKLFFLERDRITCLDLRTGAQVWQSVPLPRGKSFPSQYDPTLLVADGVVLFAGGETAAAKNRQWYTQGTDTLTALSADTGKVLWSAYHPPSGYASPEDVFVAGGLVWTGETTSGRAVGVFTGRDLHTGQVRSEFPPDVHTYWFHHRCYRGKATETYLLTSRAGTEFIDFRRRHWIPNYWIRGACLYGVMPANGLLYAPQHPCACYLETKLSGFNAVAASQSPLPAPTTARLERGPAYSQFPANAGVLAAADWPTYRHDEARSGATTASISTNLTPAWETELGGKLTPPVIAQGTVFVASEDTHTLFALDAESGRKRWTYTTGGRIDSPPTLWRGRVLFGCADGFVYCLRAADGALAWRFRAAPVDRRLLSFEQVESVWPAPGSVLVHDNVLWCVAGRSMFLDGGLRFLRLDPATGALLSETILADRDETGKPLQDYVSWLNMPVGLPDVLSCDGRYVYMRSQPFTLQGKRLPLHKMPRGKDDDAGAPPALQNPEFAHLFCPTGFRDDSWWHRTYWLYGSTFVSGWQGYYRAGKAAPAGRLLTFDDARVYGFGRKPRYFRWTTPMDYHLFAASRQALATETLTDARGRRRIKPITDVWAKDIPVLARAMVLADGTLFVAGPPAVVDEQKLFRRIRAPETAARLKEYAAALAGRRGGLLMAVSAADGQPKAQLRLAAPPVFDGMAAAGGKLYLATVAGRMVCLAGS